MTVLLAYISASRDRDDPHISLLPTGLCSLQACLREAGFDALLANFSAWSASRIEASLREIRPRILAISQWTHNRHASLELARVARRLDPACVIVMGGGHASFQYDEILRQGSVVDLVILGEGEATLLELAERLRDGGDWSGLAGIAFRRGGRVEVTRQRELLADLDALPFASRYLEHSRGVDIPLQAEFMITARGCPSSCTFCSSPGFWRRRVRFRSPENMLEEILFIRQRYGLIYFSLRDDTFTADRRRALEFCRLLIRSRAHILWNCQSRVTSLDEELLGWMKRAGCECVQIGVESGSPRILSLLGKQISPPQVEAAAAAVKKVGISLSVYLISSIPGETADDLNASIALMKRIRPDDGYVSPLAYFPGTRLFQEAVSAGRVPATVFTASREAAVYAAGKPQRAPARLLRSLTGRPERDSRCFERQKRALGYCHTTNALAGEYFLRRGDPGAAEREFREIVAREPDNPWGWYLLGDLLAEQGNQRGAADCYRRVLKLVPNHGPSLAALGK
jgi:anaerobic magnesium-protoporphyrin IX monomethyl ester cyclase